MKNGWQKFMEWVMENIIAPILILSMTAVVSGLAIMIWVELLK